MSQAYPVMKHIEEDNYFLITVELYTSMQIFFFFFYFFRVCRITINAYKVSFYELIHILYRLKLVPFFYMTLHSILRNLSSLILKGCENAKLIWMFSLITNIFKSCWLQGFWYFLVHIFCFWCMTRTPILCAVFWGTILICVV